MLTAESIDKKITTLLSGLSLQQKKTVLTVVKKFADEHTTAWEEDEYENEINSRFKDYEKGSVKTYSIQEAITAAKKNYKGNRKK